MRMLQPHRSLSTYRNGCCLQLWWTSGIKKKVEKLIKKFSINMSHFAETLIHWTLLYCSIEWYKFTFIKSTQTFFSLVFLNVFNILIIYNILTVSIRVKYKFVNIGELFLVTLTSLNAYGKLVHLVRNLVICEIFNWSYKVTMCLNVSLNFK